MLWTRRMPVLLVALAVVTIAACSGGGNGHRARGSRTTSTTTTVAQPTTTTTPAAPPSTAGRAPSPGAATPNAPTPSTARPGSVPSPQANCIAETPAELKGYLGLSLQAAQGLAASQGYHVRVVGSDGRCQAVSTELDPNRVDLYLDRGIVTAAGMG